jgi:hypothetical protein
MDASQTIEAARHSPDSTIVAIHLEALDHCMTSRQELRNAAAAAGLKSSQILIPQDGETVIFTTNQFSSRQQ